MSDISHTFGQDIDLASSGDVALVSNQEMGRQRVLRRLLTNPGELILNPEYGAGLGRFVGQPVDTGKISGAVRQNMLLEAAVSQNPPPSISIDVNQTTNTVTLDISYTDATTGEIQAIGFEL